MNEEKADLPKFRSNQYDIFEKVGVHVMVGYRHDDHGLSQIQSLLIPDQTQRNTVLRLLHNPAFYPVLPRIVHYIYELGLAADDEKRHFAALAVATLSKILPFSELIEQCILKWADVDLQDIGKRSTALALLAILQEGTHANEVFQLLKQWSGNSNLRLVSTAITVLQQIYSHYPQETLDMIQKIVLLNNILLTKRAALLIDLLYQEQPTLVINQLLLWFTESSERALQRFAADGLLTSATLKDLSKDEALCTKTVAMIHTLWEKGVDGNRYGWQEKTTKQMKIWATSALTPSPTPAEHGQYRQFFVALDQICANSKQNRLRFYLPRWQAEADAKNAKRPTEKRLNLDFFSLVDGP